MSLELPFGIKPVNPVAVDYYSGPWSGASTQEAINTANSGIPAAVRFTGLTANLVIAGEAKKYWYASGVSDSHLVNFGDTIFDGNVSIAGDPSGVAFFNNDGIITTDTFVWESGDNRLGIGTSNPLYNLDVVGNIRSSTSFETNAGGFVTTDFLNSSQSTFNNARIYLGSSTYGLNKIGFRANGADVMGITGTGVGIYTDSPEAALHVNTNASNSEGLLIKGLVAQSANLTEWQDDLGTVLAHVDSGGSAMFRDLTVDNMTVSGTFTYVNSENVTIADKQIELASNSGSAIGGDAFADQGGIVVKSTDGDKSFLWDQSSNAWIANKNLVVQGTITNPAMQTFVNNNVLFNNDVTVTNDLFVSGAISLLAPLNITGLTSTTERYVDFERANGASVLTIDSTGSSTTRMQGDNVFNIETDSSAGIMRLGNVNGRHGVYITNEGYNVGIGRVIPAVDGVTIGIAEYPVMLNGSGTFIYNNNNVDETSYERFKIGWESNDFVIRAEADGTGTIQDLDLAANQVALKYNGGTGVSTRLSTGADYIKMWRNMYPGSDSNYNCGLSTNRWNAVFADSIRIGNGVDAVLTADDDNHLALRNLTNAQRFNIYHTYTDAANYERGQFRWGSNIFVIGTESDGTGSDRSVWVNVGASSTKFEFNSTTNKSNQNLQPGTDSVYDLGSSSARWANTYTNIIDAEAGSATDVPAVIKGAAAQSANLTEWQDIVGNALAHVGSGGTISTSGDLVANTHLKFKGGNGPDIFSTSSHAYLRDATGASKLRWGTGANIFTFTGFTPNVSNTYDIGEEGNRTYRSLHLGSRVTSSGVQTSGVHLSDHVPASTTNTLYNDGGELKWNGAGISPTGTPSGVAFFGADGLMTDSPQLYYNSGTNVLTMKSINPAMEFRGNDDNLALRIGDAQAGTNEAAGLTFYWQGVSNGWINADSDGITHRIQTGKVTRIENGSNFEYAKFYGTTTDKAFEIISPASTTVLQTYQAAASQSANLTEWQNSAGDISAEVDATGQMNIYNSGGATNDYERLEVKWDTNVATIASTAAGTGTQRDLSLIAGTDSANVVQLGDRNNQRVRIGPASSQGIGLLNNGGSFQIKNGSYTSFKPITASAFIGSPGAYFGVGNTRLYAETDVFSQRNGANAQAFNIYNTYADASNYERLEFKWDANEAVLTTTAAGSGTPRGMKLQNTGGDFTIDAASSVSIKAVGAVSITAYNAIYQQFTTTGVGYRKDCYPIFDSSLDLGTASQRWANIYTNTIDVDASGATSVPAVIKGAAAQTANLTEWQASDGTVVAMVEPDGSISSSGDISASGSLITSRFMASDDGSLAAPAFSFDSQTNMGIYRSALYQMNITCGLNYGINLSPSNLAVTSGTSFSWRNGNSLSGGHSFSTQLHQEANGVIGQYSEYILEHYTPQQYNIYNYWGGNTSNWERLETKWENHIAKIQTAAAGSGVRRNIHIEAEDTVNLRNSSGSVLHCGASSRVTTYKDLVPHNNGTVDLGFSNRRWDSIWGEHLNVQTDTATNVVSTFAGAASQTANLTEWQNSAGDILAEVDATGQMNIYNSGGGTNDYERLEVKWDSDVATIDSTADGTGTARSFDISYNGSRRFRGDSAFSYMYQADGTYIAFGNSDFKAQQDSTIDLGHTNTRWANTYTDTITIGNGVNAVLTADAADTLALRNGTNAQQFNIYNTYTDASNYERLDIKWDTNECEILTKNAGTGAQRELRIGNDGGYQIFMGSAAQGAGLAYNGSTKVGWTTTSLFPFGSSITLGGGSDRWSATYTNGLSTSVETFTAASDTLDAKNHTCLCDCTSNAITLNLPAASTASGLQYHIKKTDSSSNVITISPDGSETIDGQSSYVVNNQYESITLVCDGSNWFII